MLFCLDNSRSHFFPTTWQWFLLLLIFSLIHSQQIFIARFSLSTAGTQFVPVNAPAQLISSTLADSVKKCSTLCTNNVLCRVYDYQVFIPNQCRLFEGDTNTLGQVVSSASPQSRVGTIQLSPDLFAEYGSGCFFSCSHSRYLQCGNNLTCECMPHFYWDASVSMCVPQTPVLGAPCQQNKSMCRGDLNYTCLQFNQCGPLSVLLGTTIMNGTTRFGGNATVGINIPSAIGVFGTASDSVIVADLLNNRLVGLWNVDTIYENTSVVATEWAPGQSICYPYYIHMEVRNGYDLYLSDYCSAKVIRYTNVQSVSPPPLRVAGASTGGGVGLQYLNFPFGVQMDSHGNVFVAATDDHRVTFWPPNATMGTVVAGLGTPSNTSMGLSRPNGIALDESNSWLYVADSSNNRIQRYSLNNTWPCNGTTVAGGLESGSGSHQLSSPRDIWISKKTGAMYIVDSNNHRIQRWQQGATKGVTIAGNPNGIPGTTATQFQYPGIIAFNANETYMYVTDASNNRVQRFRLI